MNPFEKAGYWIFELSLHLRLEKSASIFHATAEPLSHVAKVHMGLFQILPQARDCPTKSG